MWPNKIIVNCEDGMGACLKNPGKPPVGPGNHRETIEKTTQTQITKQILPSETKQFIDIYKETTLACAKNPGKPSGNHLAYRKIQGNHRLPVWVL